MIWGVVKGILSLIIIGALLIGAVGFYIGFSYASVTNAQYEEYMQKTSEKNTTLEALISGLSAEKNNLKNEVTNLTFQKGQLEKLNKEVTDENAMLRQQVNALKIENNALQLKSTVVPYIPQSNISSNTPVQTEQITTYEEMSGTLYTPAFNYGPWQGRPTYPSIQYYTTVTNNIVKFTEGKTFEQVVNGIRKLKYTSHANDNSNYAIQHADETLVKGGGDCTDKVLLLYACMKQMGYDESKMCVASIHSCDGGYDHNVLATTKPPFDATGVDVHYTFDIGGKKWYIIDPTNWEGTPLCSVMQYYEDCYIVGNMHFATTESLGGWDEVPMHGLKVSR